MIEVLFAESEVASMKDVKNAVLTGKTAGLVAVWSARKKKAPKKEHTGWIEGTPEEVICLGFLLDIGDIRENVNSAYRKTLIHDLYTQEAWGKNPEVDAEFWNLADICTGTATTEELSEKRRDDPNLVQRCPLFCMWFLSCMQHPFGS